MHYILSITYCITKFCFTTTTSLFLWDLKHFNQGLFLPWTFLAFQPSSVSSLNFLSISTKFCFLPWKLSISFHQVLPISDLPLSEFLW
jgi:hypothetical protein